MNRRIREDDKRIITVWQKPFLIGRISYQTLTVHTYHFVFLTMPEKKEDRRKLYFIAIVPPSPFFEETLNVKRYFSEQYASQGALKSPPHITLHMPFEWKEDKEEMLISKLENFLQSQKACSIRFKNFGCFSPKVIFVDIEKTETLKVLQANLQRFCKQELKLFNANYKELPFNPHLTVAFRDLKKPAFKMAWEEFSKRKFEGEFSAEAVALLKHTGKQWEVFRTFHLVG